MGCASGLVKYLVFIFNLIFAVAGLILLVAGILYQLNVNEMKPGLTNTAVGSAPIAVIIIGAVVFVIAFFGCCGAIKESTCMLTTYAVILLVIFILQIAIGVFLMLQVKDNSSIKSEINNALRDTFKRVEANDVAAKESFNLLQHSIQCCGLMGSSDYDSRLPPSCCRKNKDPCSSADHDVFPDGCSYKLYTTLKDNFEKLAYFALGLCITEIIAAICSLCLVSSIRSERNRGRYA